MEPSRSPRNRLATWFLSAWFGASGVCSGDEPALTVRLVRPDRQLDRLLSLFEGSRASSPAEALAGWKRATRDLKTTGLGKAREAMIAALNPGMARELRTLDGSLFLVGFDAKDGGKAWWSATIPRDDGTLAAAATAMALTDGRAEPPIGEALVDRLGPAGAPLMGQFGERVILAGSLDALKAALVRPDAVSSDRPEAYNASGWRFQLDPEGLGRDGPLARRRLAEALRGIGCRALNGSGGIEGETLSLVVAGEFTGEPVGSARVDPDWLAGTPRQKTLAAFAWAIAPRPEATAAAFTWADLVERADPTHAQAASLRIRLNLLAGAAKVRLEADLWPHLLGVSGHVSVDPAGVIDGALLALHADGEAAAERIAVEVVPRLAALAGIDPEPPGEPRAAGPRPLGRAGKRPLFVTRERSSVLIAWGEGALAASLEARTNPERSAGAEMRTGWGTTPPQRAAALWPGRLPSASYLAEAPPVLWRGTRVGRSSRDELRWAGLKGVVRRFLDRLPFEPSPDR